MREILFRGQTRRYGQKVWMNGEKVLSQWVYGGILQGIGDFSIVYGYDNPEMKGEIKKYSVYTDTIGQYTGLNDKNGKRIFEGDVLIINNCREYPVLVNFIEFGWQCVIPNVNAYIHYRHRLEDNATKYEVIGNVHDNPDLLKVNTEG